MIKPREPRIKLVAIDLDGTLLTRSKQVCARAAKALRCLPEQDVKVIIASARPPRSVRAIYQQLGLKTLQINYNGALIWDEPNQRAVFHKPMPGRLVRTMIERARDMYDEVLVSCEVLDRWYTDRADQSYTTETGRLFKPDVMAPLEQFTEQPITKLMFLGDPRIMNALEPVLAEFERKVTIVRTDDELLQVMDARVSKASALKQVAEIYRVDSKQILAIGDAPNDVGMLQFSGIAVAMDNAHTIVKHAADWIAPSNDDHGVHAALVRFGVCKR